MLHALPQHSRLPTHPGGLPTTTNSLWMWELDETKARWSHPPAIGMAPAPPVRPHLLALLATPNGSFHTVPFHGPVLSQNTNRSPACRAPQRDAGDLYPNRRLDGSEREWPQAATATCDLSCPKSDPEPMKAAAIESLRLVHHHLPAALMRLPPAAPAPARSSPRPS